MAGSSGEALTRLLRLHVGLNNFPVADVVETRVMLERWSVSLAAANATPADLELLRALLDRMDDTTLSRETFNDLDTAFHVAMAEASGSRLAADLTSAVRGALRYALLGAFEEITDWEATAAGLRAEHHAIHDRIADGDGTGAADVVEQHVRGFFGRLSSLVPERP